MNWFTRGCGCTVSDDDNFCEHLEVGDTSFMVTREHDTLGGPETSHWCEECFDKLEEEEDNVEEPCSDCGNIHRMGAMIEWKWYDFDYNQGDEPLRICKVCRGKDKHKVRVARNAADYEAEMDYYDQNYGF